MQSRHNERKTMDGIYFAIDSGYHEPSIGELSREAMQIDADVCANQPCDCGHVGMRYIPMVRNGSYLAFAVCPKCGRQEEF